MRKKIKVTDEGFTLVELLVVIIIIGILAAVAVPAFLNQRQKANGAALKSDVKNLALNYEEWGVGYPNVTYPNVSHNWAVTSNSDPTTFIYKTSTGTRFHAFDMSSYYPAKGYKAGQIFCIEATNTGIDANSPGGTSNPIYYNSVTGGLTNTACVFAPNAP